MSVLKEGHDPKNRLVTLSKEGTKYTCEKQDTGYLYSTSSKEKAEAAFTQQIECSQNQ